VPERRTRQAAGQRSASQILSHRMSKTFRAWKINEPLFLPPTVQDFVAEDHLARFVLSLVGEDLDLIEITGTYGSERGQPPFDPTIDNGAAAVFVLLRHLLLAAHRRRPSRPVRRALGRRQSCPDRSASRTKLVRDRPEYFSAQKAYGRNRRTRC
jgi:hypothetical protein